MFCPNCKSEYRPGFTKCADCGVGLVATLPAGANTVDSNIPRSDEGLEPLWSGVSEALTDQIDAALEAAHITHKITDKEFGLLPNLAQSVNFVWIDPRDRASSRAILASVLAGSGALEQEAERYPPDGRRMNPLGLGRKIYPSDDGNSPLLPDLLPDSPFDSTSLFGSSAPAGSNEPVPDDIVEDFDPEDAIAEVWVGDDRELADYLKMCLAGVGVGSVVHEDCQKIRIFVLPAKQTRAREIVREVVDAEPPQ
jgi:hypothetical protein